MRQKWAAQRTSDVRRTYDVRQTRVRGFVRMAYVARETYARRTSDRAEVEFQLGRAGGRRLAIVIWRQAQNLVRKTVVADVLLAELRARAQELKVVEAVIEELHEHVRLGLMRVTYLVALLLVVVASRAVLRAALEEWLVLRVLDDRNVERHGVVRALTEKVDKRQK